MKKKIIPSIKFDKNKNCQDVNLNFEMQFSIDKKSLKKLLGWFNIVFDLKKFKNYLKEKNYFLNEKVINFLNNLNNEESFNLDELAELLAEENCPDTIRLCIDYVPVEEEFLNEQCTKCWNTALEPFIVN